MRKRQSQFHIYLDNYIMDKLKKLAMEEGRNVTDIIREAVAELLRKREMHKIRKESGKL